MERGDKAAQRGKQEADKVAHVEAEKGVHA